jgi:Tfp pilus assembly protein PilO
MRVARKKTNRKWLMIMLLAVLACIACLAVYFQWGMEELYLSLVEKPNGEHDQLVSEIETVRQEIAGLPNLVDEREAQLEYAQQLLYEEQNKMPYIMSVNNPVRSIVELANLCEVNALPLRTTAPDSEIVNGYQYDRWNIYLSVTGELSDIAKFVDNLDGKYLPTAIVQGISLHRSDEDTENPDGQSSVTTVGGNIDLVIYTLSPNYVKESR